MTVRFAQWTLDVRDVERMARFWSAALGFDVQHEDDGSAHLKGKPRG
jgi:catechol-2,3-dioxygenase